MEAAKRLLFPVSVRLREQRKRPGENLKSRK